MWLWEQTGLGRPLLRLERLALALIRRLILSWLRFGLVRWDVRIVGHFSPMEK
jgi:hypothetical protein